MLHLFLDKSHIVTEQRDKSSMGKVPTPQDKKYYRVKLKETGENYNSKSDK